MNEKLPPISPYEPAPIDNQRHGKDKISKAGRSAKILCLAVVVVFFGYYAARAYYVTKFPQSTPLIDEFQGSYCCSCKEGFDSKGYTIRETLSLTPQLFLFPILETSWNPFYISIFWQPPDGGVKKVTVYPYVASDLWWWCPNCVSSGYFYASGDQIELITDDGHVNLVPIRWGSAKYLVETTRIADFCRGPVLATQCYYSDNKPIGRSKPVYLDGTQVCE